jgi:hypothetical protein
MMALSVYPLVMSVAIIPSCPIRAMIWSRSGRSSGSPLNVRIWCPIRREGPRVEGPPRPTRRCNLACTYCNEFDHLSQPVFHKQTILFTGFARSPNGFTGYNTGSGPEADGAHIWQDRTAIPTPPWVRRLAVPTAWRRA